MKIRIFPKEAICTIPHGNLAERNFGFLLTDRCGLAVFSVLLSLSSLILKDLATKTNNKLFCYNN